MTRLRRLASLQGAAETETAFGGRSRVWSEVATVWVDLREATPSEHAQAGQRPDLLVAAKAEGREHSAAEPGQRLSLDGETWRVVRIVRGLPSLGRMTLFLEKDLS